MADGGGRYQKTQKSGIFRWIHWKIAYQLIMFPKRARRMQK